VGASFLEAENHTRFIDPPLPPSLPPSLPPCLQVSMSGGRVGACFLEAENQTLVRGLVPAGERAAVMPREGGREKGREGG